MMEFIHTSSRKIWRTQPKIDVEPQLESDYQKRIGGKIFVRINAPPRFSSSSPIDTD
jgi:hypothetical protein